MTEEQNTEPSAYPIGARVCAELAGSFLVCFAIYMICTFGTSIYGLDLAYIVVGTALAYAVVTAMLGRVSGGQFNPAITVAAILTGKTKVVAGILYVIVQVVGAIAAAGAVRWILPTSQTVTMKTWLPPAVNGYGTGSVSSATTSSASVSFGISMAIVVEVIAAIIIIAVAMRHTDANGKPNATYAPVIGAAYGLGVAMTYTVTGAALNPARATGIALFGQNQGLSTQPLQQLWIFWLAPVLAAAIVALVMIIADMASKRKPKTPADAPIDEATDAEADAHDIAVDAADIALVSDDIQELPHLLWLAKRMMGTIRCNMSFSMALNFVAILLAIGGILNPVVGALVHNAGSVLVIINSAFLLHWKKKA